MKIGAQQYTVREFTQTVHDFESTIKKVAEIGYNCVQISAIGTGIKAEEVADICKRNNIEIVITHTPLDRIINETQKVISEHALMGAKYIGVGALPWGSGNSKEGYVNFVRDTAPAAKAIKEAGFQFMYHNHDFEFMKFDDKTAMDYLAENFPDAGFTLDTFWVQMGGGDSSQWLKKLAGRVDVIHVKDLVIVNSERRMCEVLEGNLNWDAIFEACEQAGVKYAMVEQDDCYGKDPFECLSRSLHNIMNWQSRPAAAN
jgi:sugar phosphate isomerase/epimerase